MDVASYIALLVFGIIVLIGWLLMQKFNLIEKLDIKHLFKLANLKLLPIHGILILMGLGGILWGGIGLLCLL